MQKNDGNDGVGKIRTKTYFIVFLNVRSILDLMLCNQNLTKLVYQTLLSSDCRLWALKLGEHLKKRKKKRKRTLIGQLNRTINHCKILYVRTHPFCKNILIYSINNTSMVLEIFVSQFSCILKIMARNTFPEPQPDSAF